MPAQPAEEAGAPALADAVAAPQADVVTDESSAEPVMAAANGRATDGAKSLGFFA
jgi:hypothetical protein